MAYLHGTFKDIEENTIEVQIRSNQGSGNIVIGENHNSQVFFSDDPIEISMEADDMFEHILKKSCKITLLSKIYLGDKVFAGNEEDVTVTVLKNNVVIFSGFVEPNTYTQPYAYQLEEFTLNCIDFLSTLQYKSLLDTRDYSSLLADSGIYTFNQYLDMMSFPGTINYDNSKNINGQSALDVCSVSLTAFLGDDETDVMTFEDMLKELLQYLNLHIIQEGENFYIFDWKSIENNNLGSNITVKKENYSSDNTTLSMSEVYNQISIKCDLEEVEDVISSPLESDDLDSYYDRPQLYMTEYWSCGEGSSAYNAFRNLITSPMTTDRDSTESNTDYDAWGARDWYVKWLYNPKWSLTYQNSDIEGLMNENNGVYLDQYKVMEHLKTKKFFPALIQLSSQKTPVGHNNNKRTNSKLTSANYLVISSNGNEQDTDEEATNIDTANQTASGTVGLFTYNSSNSASFSPTDSNTKNYIVFSGKIVLAPLVMKSYVSQRREDVTFAQQQEMTRNSPAFPFWIATCPAKENSNSDGAFYAQEFWKASRTNYVPVPQYDALWMYPYQDIKDYYKFQYNYSSDGSTSDTYDKIPVLECQMKIGDKYLVEYSYNLNGGKPRYAWLRESECPFLKDDDGNDTEERKKTFTLGFDPNIGDYIIGKEYELANTVDGRISDEEGTAIKITNADALSGRVEFKIIGAVNTSWNDITRRHPTLFRHTKWYDNYRNLLSHTSAIWIKDFNIKLISDNSGMDVKSQSKDLVYLSDEQHTYIKKRDEIEFKINTMPTVQEAVDLGIKTTVSKTNVINKTTNLALEGITANNTYDRPERLYIDQYWRYYNRPKVLLETELHDNGYSIFNTFTFNGFGKTMPTTIINNIKTNNVRLICRQI